MSFISFNGNEEEIQSVSDNNPAWRKKHYVHYEDIIDFNIPSINIGPYGFSTHSKYERVELKYATEIVPNIIQRLLNNK